MSFRTGVRDGGQPSSSSPITSLDQLGEYIDIQNTGINNLSPKAVTTDFASYDFWEKFRQQFWGKGLKSLEKEEVIHIDPITEAFLPEKPPSDPHLIMEAPGILPSAFTLESRSILVRSEYKETEKAALSSLKSSDCLFMVCGTPGIGKSVFLLWLLIRRLALGLPTILQKKILYPILFHENGVYRLTQINDSESYQALAFPKDCPTHRIWALFDTTTAFPEPADCFLPPSPFFLVSAASPRSEYQEWHKKHVCTLFFMSPWSFSEVLQARHIFDNDPTELELSHLYETYGASPRELARFSKSPQAYANRLNREINKIKAADIRGIFEDPASHPASHFVVTLYPSNDRSDCIVAPASQHVFALLADKHLKSRVEDMAYFYDLFQESSVTSSTAGFIFKLRMHDVLWKKQTIRLFPIICNHRGPKNFIYDTYEEESSGMEYALPKLKLLSLAKGTQPETNSYCVPDSRNFPTVDSLLFFDPLDISSPILLMLQMTRNQTHDTKVEGLRNIDDLGFPSEVRRWHVVVTPERISPRITVPMEYFGEKLEEVKQSPDKAFPVFHCPITQKELFPVERLEIAVAQG